ncbi:MAG: hypothetical protein OXH76_06780 [Boseongicola sp.]|nr:hypothetical protein [Boseongicola sp.]MYH56536.1 hypothetical protein [Boseongicola sp. SB0675_bin_26]
MSAITKINDCALSGSGSDSRRCPGDLGRSFPEGRTGRQKVNSTGRKIHHVLLDDDERARLREIADGGKGSMERRRAGILLLADRSRDDGGRGDADIAGFVDVGTAWERRSW